jgi:magnesium transporter
MTNLDAAVDPTKLEQLITAVKRRAPLDALVLLERESDAMIAAVMERLEPTFAVRILSNMSAEHSQALVAKIKTRVGEQWTVNLSYPEDSVGRLMEPPLEIFLKTMRVADVIEQLRQIAEERQIVYAFAVDEKKRLAGVVVMRDLLFAKPDDKLEDLMIEEPFYFNASTSLEDAMRAVLLRHYPIYPVCDEQRKLVGFVRGYALFEQQAFELTAQPGRMVGIEKEEHVSTPWTQCLRMRHPWLQLNLLTAFVAGGVVGMFEDTIAKVVVLAAFLPVLAGQSGNTGCQALAVTLRGMTLNELKPGMERGLLIKESLLGLFNGLFVGITAGIGMYIYAHMSGSAVPLMLAGVVVLAMVGSCIASGMIGVLVPLTLRRFGFDPVTASTIFLTTGTDVASMGLLLALATILVL